MCFELLLCFNFNLKSNSAKRCGASFEIEIVSEQFEGKKLLERHRMVNAAVAEQMKEIHALSIKKAVTPSKWNPIPKVQEE